MPLKLLGVWACLKLSLAMPKSRPTQTAMSIGLLSAWKSRRWKVASAWIISARWSRKISNLTEPSKSFTMSLTEKRKPSSIRHAWKPRKSLIWLCQRVRAFLKIFMLSPVSNRMRLLKPRLNSKSWHQKPLIYQRIRCSSRLRDIGRPRWETIS